MDHPTGTKVATQAWKTGERECREVRKCNYKGEERELESKETRRDKGERKYCGVRGPTCKARHGWLPLFTSVTLEAGR